jgi:hypothetical protein
VCEVDGKNMYANYANLCVLCVLCVLCGFFSKYFIFETAEKKRCAKSLLCGSLALCEKKIPQTSTFLQAWGIFTSFSYGVFLLFFQKKVFYDKKKVFLCNFYTEK